MAMSVFIGLPTKPNKSHNSAIARASGMAEKDDPKQYVWAFEKKKLRVMLEDMREAVKIDREWADEVGWIHNWSIVVQIATNRSSEDYLEWMSLITMLCKSNNATFLFFDEGTGDPQVRYRLTDFFQGVLDGNMHDESGAAVESEEVEEEPEAVVPSLFESPAPAPAPTPAPASEDTDLQELIRKELEKGGYYRKLEEENVSTEVQGIELEPADEEDDFELYDDWDED